ncbi:Uncharacterised protein [Sphingobacterium spiritivorum]|uniref:Uncharacterized protein n=1 Tax=Sphingobacterium spiritivorum TaxID=258 RepID=A0A380CS01_SPHSI|nr:hypothetical protein [Sphingobacterium spiritivorum]SUJ26799.1 Uncharacterised protein [Sphingobacterium spiritivorum]
MKIDKNGDSNDGSEYMLTYKDVVEFKKRLSSNKTINDSICNWLANPMPHYDQKNEAVKNSLLWRDLLNDSNVDLFVISYLRALYSNGSTPKGRFKANVLSRRGTIIFNKGYVNGTDKLKTFACLNDSISQDEKLKNEFLLNVFSEIYSISKVNVGKNDCNVTDAYFVEGKKKNHKLYRTLVYRKGNNYYTSDEFTKWCINKMPFVSSEFDENASVEKHNSDYQLLNIFYRDFGNDSYFSLRLEDNKKDPSKKMVSILPNSELTNDLYKFPAKEECDK